MSKATFTIKIVGDNGTTLSPARGRVLYARKGQERFDRLTKGLENVEDCHTVLVGSDFKYTVHGSACAYILNESGQTVDKIIAPSCYRDYSEPVPASDAQALTDKLTVANAGKPVEERVQELKPQSETKHGFEALAAQCSKSVEVSHPVEDPEGKETTRSRKPKHKRPDYSNDTDVIPEVAEPPRAPDSTGTPQLHVTLDKCRSKLDTCKNRLSSFMAHFEADTTIGVNMLGDLEFYKHPLVEINKEAAAKVDRALIEATDGVTSDSGIASRISEAVNAINDYNQELYYALINRDKWEDNHKATVFECITPTTYKQMRADVHALANCIVLI
ncbi:hypothetical protein VpasPP24_14 [Vibrio phage Vpas_PP24]|nr:hypothetical protein VpasPP24_14 [Vibrio phage Vpas_PP24]